MASSPLRSKSRQHIRSVSLPSRLHPLTPQVDEHFCRLRSSEVDSTSFSSIGNRLTVLEDMYKFFDDLLQSPNTQKAFSKNEKWVDEILDGYLRILDLCATARDVSSQTKQDVQSRLSMLRRRRDINEFGEYLSSRKKTKKSIQKSLKDLKNIKIKQKDNETTEICTLFKELESATVAVFESLLFYIAGTKSQSKFSGLFTKLIHGKNVSFKDGGADTNEFEKVDAAIDLLLNQKTCKHDNASSIENLQSRLGEMESNIQDLEQGLECLFRHLIKTRVSLLNILNH